METRSFYIARVSKRIRSLFPLLGVAVFIVAWGWTGAACSSYMEEPEDWYQTGEHPSYSTDRYIVAVGFGDTTDAADDMARGEISKFFESRVVSVTREEEKYENNKHSFESRSFVRVRGEANLEGVEIVRRTMDKGVHYSLGVLDKVKLLSRLRKDLTFLDLKIEEALRTEEAVPEARIKALYKVVYLLTQRDVLAKRLNILGYRATLDPNKYEPVYTELKQLVATTYPVTIRSASKEVSTFLVKALTDEGFTVLEEDSEDPQVVVDVELTTQFKRVNRMVEFSYDLRLACTGHGKKVAETRLAERLQHYNKDSARQKSLYEMRDKAVRPFVRDIRREFLGEPEKTTDKD